MYKNKLVAAISVNGKFLREDGECSVYLPFGSEYKIFLKNLHPTKRVVLNISIDGKSISGQGLVLAAMTESFIERPVNHAHKFKFIERTNNIEQFRGVKPEDGLIVINYQFETVFPSVDVFIPYYYEDNNSNYVSNIHRSPERGIECCAASSSPTFSAQNQVGITGKGRISDQQFGRTSVSTLESKVNTIVFHLLGKSNDVKVSEPFDTRKKKFCDLCGQAYPSNMNYCYKDGNALIFSVC